MTDPLHNVLSTSEKPIVAVGVVATQTLDLPPGFRGRAAALEAAVVLNQLEFSQHRGDCAEGDHVLTVVTPYEDSDNKFRIGVTCYPTGAVDVDWQKLVLVAKPKNSEGPAYTSNPLSKRGQAHISGLPFGNYTIELKLLEQ